MARKRSKRTGTKQASKTTLRGGAAKRTSKKKAGKKSAKKSSQRARAGAKRRASAREAEGLALPFLQVDAFTSRRFHGNPAGVAPLDDWLDDDTLQAIAAEHNLSETAFIVASGNGASRSVANYEIRWFTPTVEVDLCGHATLAAAHALWEYAGVRAKAITFESRSGTLHATREAGLITLDFPAQPVEPCPRAARALAKALGREPAEVLRGKNYVAVFESKRDVHELRPDFRALAELDAMGVIVTAPAVGHDFVSRYFAPAAGIDEDPVTGSAHCTLAPYWAERLGRSRLTAHQVSARGGELLCEVVGDRVRLSGRAVTYLIGVIHV